MTVPYSYRGSDRQHRVVLDNGAAILMRPATRTDRELFSQGIREMSYRSRYLRFHSGFERVPSRVLDRLAQIDGQNHIAWGAIDKNNLDHPAIAAAHAIRDSVSMNTAELACGVLDNYQRQGIASLLLALVLQDCSDLGITNLYAYILYENKPATCLVNRLGGTRIGEFGIGEIFALETDKSLNVLLTKGMHGAIASLGIGS